MFAMPTLAALTPAAAANARGASAAAGNLFALSVNSMTQSGPLVLGAILIIGGVVCSLALLVSAFAIEQRHSRRARAARDQAARAQTSLTSPTSPLAEPRPVPRLTLLGQPEPQPMTAAPKESRHADVSHDNPADDPAALILRTWEAGPVADEDEEEWHPLTEEIAGVGRVEWDPKTLRAFAGRPDVLSRLAFHRWRYQQGRLSEFELDRNAMRRRSSPRPRRSATPSDESYEPHSMPQRAAS